jgi:hypothetical protein
MTDKDCTRENNKQNYEKPRLRVIELAAEEVLATGCKIDDVTIGFGGGLCTAGVCSVQPGS